MTFSNVEINFKSLSLQGPAAVVLEVYANGAAGKDGRLKSGDQIVECGGVPLKKEMTHERLCLTIKQSAPKVISYL